MRKSLLAVGAAAALVAGSAQAASVQAAPVRAPASVENTESLGGIGSVWLVAAFAAVALGLILLLDDDDGAPASP